MYINTRQKHMFIYLLLCALFLTSFSRIYNGGTNIFPETNVLTGSPLSGEDSQSSMQAGINFWQFGNMANIESSSLLLALKQSQNMNTKNGLNPITVVIASLIIYAICSPNLLHKFCTPLNSLQIIVFLHKKDGMK